MNANGINGETLMMKQFIANCMEDAMSRIGSALTGKGNEK